MKKLSFLLFTVLLIGCGGGGGGSGSSSNGGATPDLFQSLSTNVFTGGYRSVSKVVADTGNTTITSCGYQGAFYDRATIEAELLKQGGSVTISTSTEWCGTAAGETGCIKQFDKVFVIDSRSAQQNTVDLYMTGLVANRMTVITFDSLTYNFSNGKYEPLAVVETSSRDASIPEGAAGCSNQIQPTQTNDAINGNWTGYKATYDPLTIKVSTAAATVSCVNQSCTTSDLPGVTVTLSDFRSGGTWEAAAGAPRLAGATISADRQLLSMFVCNAPLDESKTFENCSFFTLKR